MINNIFGSYIAGSRSAQLSGLRMFSRSLGAIFMSEIASINERRRLGRHAELPSIRACRIRLVNYMSYWKRHLSTKQFSSITEVADPTQSNTSTVS